VTARIPRLQGAGLRTFIATSGTTARAAFADAVAEQGTRRRAAAFPRSMHLPPRPHRTPAPHTSRPGGHRTTPPPKSCARAGRRSYAAEPDVLARREGRSQRRSFRITWASPVMHALSR
jgi:hypothetical protein